MRLLLDTHIALWAVTNHPRLPAQARELISDTDNEVSISAATIWEISIKHGLARGDRTRMPLSGAEALGYFQQSGYRLLAISPAHAAAVEDLPPLHADPFDRMMVAQALFEPMRLVTQDRQGAAYSDTILNV